MENYDSHINNNLRYKLFKLKNFNLIRRIDDKIFMLNN